MNLAEMHKLFRVLGQQMGIQQIRGILPSEIDSYLNDAIITKVRTLLADTFKVDAQSQPYVGGKDIMPINALRPLYTEASGSVVKSDGKVVFTPTASAITDLMFILGISASINSDKAVKCRIVDNISLEDTINDYCNRGTKKYPVASVNPDNTIDIYMDDFTELKDNITVKIKFYRKPAIVLLNESAGTETPCDLPDYLHTEIVEIAVNKFFQSVGYTSPTKNQKETV